MRKAFGLIFCMASLVWAQTNHQARPVAASTRVHLVATTDGTSFKLGAPVVLKLVMRNAASEAIKIGDSSPDYDYQFVVTDSSGKELPRTDWGNRLLEGMYVVLHSDSQDLEPSHEVHAEMDITRIYQIDHPGTYYARAVFHAILSKSVNGVDVSSIEESKRPMEHAFSNPVQFTIVP